MDAVEMNNLRMFPYEIQRLSIELQELEAVLSVTATVERHNERVSSYG